MHVRIKSDGTNLGTLVTNSDGEAVPGVVSIAFRAEINDISRADISLSAVEIDAVADARFYVCGREVRRIEYADGTTDDYPA